MRTLLLLMISMVTAARGATAEDTRCVLERAAMVETIRTYARSHVSGLGQQGLSERVLDVIRHAKFAGRLTPHNMSASAAITIEIMSSSKVLVSGAVSPISVARQLPGRLRRTRSNQSGRR